MVRTSLTLAPAQVQGYTAFYLDSDRLVRWAGGAQSCASLPSRASTEYSEWILRSAAGAGRAQAERRCHLRLHESVVLEEICATGTPSIGTRSGAIARTAFVMSRPSENR